MKTLTGHAGYIEGTGVVICGGAVARQTETLKVASTKSIKAKKRLTSKRSRIKRISGLRKLFVVVASSKVTLNLNVLRTQI